MQQPFEVQILGMQLLCYGSSIAQIDINFPAFNATMSRHRPRKRPLTRFATAPYQAAVRPRLHQYRGADGMT